MSNTDKHLEQTLQKIDPRIRVRPSGPTPPGMVRVQLDELATVLSNQRAWQPEQVRVGPDDEGRPW